MNEKQNILIAPDSFKECADSVTIAEILKSEFQKRGFLATASPVSDGGDGFLNVIKYYYKTESVFTEVTSLTGKYKQKVECAFSPESRIVFVESADVVGVKLVPPAQRYPLHFSSHGIGELLLNLSKGSYVKEVKQSGEYSFDKVVIGIGGTAVIDFGLGALSALGLKTIDFYGKMINPLPDVLYKISGVVWNDPVLPFSLEFILDVKNPLLGNNGGIMTFGPQKGAKKAELKVVELGVEKFCKLLKRKMLIDSSENLPGAGGGIAAGLKIFLNAGLKYAEEFILNDLGVEKKLMEHNTIITGEGSFDIQSDMGKGAGIILSEAAKFNKRVFLICGRFNGRIQHENVHVIELKKYFSSEEESKKNIGKALALACGEIIDVIKP